MNFEEIEKKVLKWGADRGILTESSHGNQIEKLEEEFNELYDAEFTEDIVDGIGDMLVVLTFIAYFRGFSLTRCYNIAYEVIKDRKGKMIDGIFVKEE